MVVGCQLIGDIDVIHATDGSEAGQAGDGSDGIADATALDASGSSDSGVLGASEGGTRVQGLSCVGLPATCGGSSGCCASNVVAGGTFNRSNDPGAPASVSSFKLDVYEVTVGRFRAFVNAGKGTQASPPSAGDGAHPKIAASGWDSRFNENLAPTTVALQAALKCDVNYPAWTDAPDANETRPVNCATWFDAFAFCAWDGGRLPTEAEWSYAATGGSEQRLYAWGTEDIDPSKASYGCLGDGSGGPPEAGACAFSDLLAVGTKSPQGDGKWGQADLAGNLWEWGLDWYASPYLSPCSDCANLQYPTGGRVFSGGSFFFSSTYLLSSNRNHGTLPTARAFNIGFRCARDL